jgi:nitric oxide reductase NorE protein
VNERSSVLDELPGELLMWVLIASELLVFGAGLCAFLAVRVTDPAGFAAAQLQLHGAAAGVNTLLLVTSGYTAALAVRASGTDGRRARLLLCLTGALGVAFLVIKGIEFRAEADRGIGVETHPFFTFYFLLTGFHAAHVVAGLVILGIVGWRLTPHNAEVGVAFWHMVDLVWVLLFPVIYLVR